MEVAQQGVASYPQGLEVHGIRVGKQQQTIPPGEADQHALGNQRLGEDAVPDLAKALVLYTQIEDFAEFLKESARLQQAGLEALHQPGGRDSPRDLGRRVRA